MADNDLRREFGLRLRDHLRQKRIRQAELAGRLHLTPSAVSQILSGRIVPTQQVFDRVAEFLSLSCDETERLQSMLLGIRSGMHRMQSSLNRRIFALRCQSGYSPAEIERLAGISAERMKQLESLSSAVPTATERELLTQLFGEELLPSEHRYVNRKPSPVIEIAETWTPYSRQQPDLLQILVLPPDEFADFHAGDSLADFIECRGSTFVPVEYSPEWSSPVVVQGSGESFHLKADGTLRLVVVEPGSIEKPPFVFCGDGHGNFFVRGNIRDAGLAVVSDRRFKAAWRLPVVEMRFRPAQKNSRDKEMDQ